MLEDNISSVPPVAKRIADQTPDAPVPICVLVVGMAGSGKTTLMSALQNSTLPDEDEEGNAAEGNAEQQDDDKSDQKPAATTTENDRNEEEATKDTPKTKPTTDITKNTAAC